MKLAATDLSSACFMDLFMFLRSDASAISSILLLPLQPAHRRFTSSILADTVGGVTNKHSPGLMSRVAMRPRPCTTPLSATSTAPM